MSASPPANLRDQLAAAFRLLQAGDLAGAARTVEAVLRAAPAEPQALHLLAAVKRQQGDQAGALKAFDATLRAAPNLVPAIFNRANLLLEMGRPADAEQGYCAALKARPDHGETYLNRARANAAMARHEEALADFERAAALGVRHVSVFAGRGASLAALARYEEALAVFEVLLAAAPADADIHFNRARALQQLGRSEEALAAYTRASEVAPNDAAIWDHRGVVLTELDRVDEALADFAHAHVLRPDHPETYANEGLALLAAQRTGAAIAAFDRALALAGKATPPARLASLRYNRAMAALATHDLAGGWPGFEARREAGMVVSPSHARGERVWRGEKLSGALRIWPEQGVGDEILFARLAPLAQARAEAVMLECDPRLAPLLARSFPMIDVRAVGEGAKAAAQIACGSLGAAMGVTAADFDGAAYLQAEPMRRQSLRAKYEALAGGRPIVGIAWASKSPKRGVHKSAEIAQWGELLRRDCLFVSLQYGDVSADLAEARALFGCEILVDDSVDQMRDLDAFAAQVAAMDQIVSVSNTTVHVAGALGMPAIVLAPPSRGRLWYWGLEGDATPWYRSVRIVRRGRGEEWAPQIAAAAHLALDR